ncbi:hypothetical protein PR202_gb26492 [Eleusine coracana subsp. coracana]|uniref:Uncharacterized protein n=1 Tax=Eleusine coracana subsp. coracana TaxID=191504 RepID=A0AAV5FRZ7_ELECO|nr:hypothetical protein PR202_gb26492 [Eleusine coracana subsp. coracana]
MAGDEKCTLPFKVLPLEGEQDCRLGRVAGPLSTDEDLELGAPGLPRVAEVGLSDSDVLRFGGASREKPGISDGFHGLDLTVGELPLDGVGAAAFASEEPLDTVDTGLEIDEDLTGAAKLPSWAEGAEGRLVGVAALEAGLLCAGIEGLDDGVDDLVAGIDDLEVGVDDLLAGADALPEGAAVLLAGPAALVEGVADLAEGSVDLEDLEVGVDDLEAEAPVLAGTVAREVGVEGLEPLELAVNDGRPVGVEGLDPLDVSPPDDDGRRIVEAEFKLFDDAVLNGRLVLDGGSGWLAN